MTLMDRAQNILRFRRIDMHGTKTGPNADPDYWKYHPGYPGAGTKSKAFQEWFGDSQVVDEFGNPLVVYHSTNYPVSDFKAGSHFGTSEAANERYEHMRDFDDEVGRSREYRIYPVYLKIENPLEMPDLVDVQMKDIVDYRGSYLPDDAFRNLSWESIDNTDLKDYLLSKGIIDIDEYELWYGHEIYYVLEEKGYDGIKYTNGIEDKGSTSWIIFNPEQVKSATGNSGGYDPENPRLGFKR
jgi:hypothetical protein